MALIPFAEKKLIRPDANDPRIKARIGILHVDAGNASSLYGLFLGNQRSGGSKVESHGFVTKTGHLEQYRDTDFEADAQLLGNPFALSFETQGYGAGLWTAEQIATIKRLMLWCRDEHGIPLRVVTSYNDPKGGWGFHRMFKEWNPNAHSCPGDDRVKQFNDVLVPWMHAQNHPAAAPKPAAVDPALAAAVITDLKHLRGQHHTSLVFIARSALYAAAQAKHGADLTKVNDARALLKGIDNDEAPGLTNDLKALRAKHKVSLVFIARMALRAARKAGSEGDRVAKARAVLRGVDNPL